MIKSIKINLQLKKAKLLTKNNLSKKQYKKLGKIVFTLKKISQFELEENNKKFIKENN